MYLYIVRRLTSTLILVCFFLIPRSPWPPVLVLIQPRWSLQSKDPVRIQIRWWISTWRQPLQLWTSAETRTPRWAPETDPQWGPRHLDSHRENITGTSGALTIWLCCSWNKLLVRLAREELPGIVNLNTFIKTLSSLKPTMCPQEVISTCFLGQKTSWFVV